MAFLRLVRSARFSLWPQRWFTLLASGTCRPSWAAPTAARRRRFCTGPIEHKLEKTVGLLVGVVTYQCRRQLRRVDQRAQVLNDDARLSAARHAPLRLCDNIVKIAGAAVRQEIAQPVAVKNTLEFGAIASSAILYGAAGSAKLPSIDADSPITCVVWASSCGSGIYLLFHFATNDDLAA